MEQNNEECCCKVCGRKPDEINEYITSAKYEGCTPEEYVKSTEGTYDRKTNKFYCTECYIKVGMPSGNQFM